jgi:hypothetical protein
MLRSSCLLLAVFALAAVGQAMPSFYGGGTPIYNSPGAYNYAPQVPVYNTNYGGYNGIGASSASSSASSSAAAGPSGYNSFSTPYASNFNG